MGSSQSSSFLMSGRGKLILAGIGILIAVVFVGRTQDSTNSSEISSDTSATQISASTAPRTPIASRNIDDIITEPVSMCGSALSGQIRDKTRIFESVPVKSMALSQKTDALFALNGPANCLEIYRI